MADSNRWNGLLLALLLGAAAGACERREVTPTSVPTTPVQSPAVADALSSTQVAFQWLQLTCGLGDEPKLATRLRANRTAVEPILLRAYREGPSAEVMKEFTASARGRYAGGGRRGLPGPGTRGLREPLPQPGEARPGAHRVARRIEPGGMRRLEVACAG